MSIGPSLGRTSALTKTSIRILTTTLLVGLFPSVSAECWLDDYGYQQCRLDTGVIAGIAVVAFFIVGAIILIVWACLRRRRTTQTTIVYPAHAQPGAYLPQAQPGTGIVYGSPYSPGQPQFTAQYPIIQE